MIVFFLRFGMYRRCTQEPRPIATHSSEAGGFRYLIRPKRKSSRLTSQGHTGHGQYMRSAERLLPGAHVRHTGVTRHVCGYPYMQHNGHSFLVSRSDSSSPVSIHTYSITVTPSSFQGVTSHVCQYPYIQYYSHSFLVSRSDFSRLSVSLHTV
jgi:hypothetical protein